MALADTAALIASLELQDKFSSTVNKYDKAVSGMQRKSNTLDKVGFQIGRGARNAVDNVGRIAVVGAGLVASQVALGVRSLAQLETVQNQTEAAIKSTGGAADVTAEQVRNLSESLEDLSTVDDKTIQAGANLLLTFTKIRNEVGEGNDIFNRATDAALNLSLAGFGSMESTAKQVGKALNDPIKGVTALRKAGVQLTDQQTAQIKKFVESGNVLEAQKVILAELETQVGQSAEAFAKGPAADMRRFGDAVEGAQQALATGFLPVIKRVSELVQDALADPKVLANIKSFGEGLAGGVEDLIAIGTKLPWDAIGQSAKLMGQGAKALLDAFTGLPPWVQTAVLTSWGLNKLTGGALGNIAGTLIGKSIGGLFGQLRGATPATPVFTKEVGLPGGGGGGAPVAGPLAGIGGIGGLSAILATIAGGVSALTATNKAVENGQVNLTAALQGIQGPGGLIERAVGDLLETIGIKIRNDTILGGRKPGAATPIGQFVPANKGGTPQFQLPKGVLKTVDSQLQRVQTQQTRLLRAGHDKQARLLQTTIDTLHALRGDGKTDTNRVIIGLGQTHAALSAANRKLDTGTTLQQRIGNGIDRTRERLGTGFQSVTTGIGTSNSKLGTIAAKDFSPSFTANVYATTQVSIDAINRAQTSARIAIGRGPLETFDH